MKNNPFSLEGRVALVTGAGTGLGAAMATALAKAGADVVAHTRQSPVDSVRDAVEGSGRRLAEARADLTDPSSTAALAEQALAAFGRIDVLVNNAGMIRRADLIDFNEADWDDVMNTNCKSLFLLSQHVARHMVERGNGKIVNIASMLSYQGGIRVPSYTASKHAVMGLTRIMANELAPKGVNVNAIAPGYMATANTQALRDDTKRNTEILARIPAGRWGRPDDLGGAVVFLASSASDYLHGVTLPVDGGWLAR